MIELDSELTRLAIRRFLIILAVSVVFVFAISELTFRLQPHNIDRGPETIELVIPAGTQDKIDAGEPVPSIPEEMVFVLGDVLLVKNEDVVAHELGPLFVPPGAQATLPMDQADNFAATCSFSSSNYLGLSVIEPTTIGTRILGVVFAAPATTIVLFLYSLAVRPLKQEEDAEPAVAGA